MFALATSACGGRGCGVKQQSSGGASSDRDEPTLSPRALARCQSEVRAGTVAIVPGSGAFESLHATCVGDELSAWVVRGHTLSRTQRSLREGSSWAPAAVVAQGVEGLSVLASDVGPIAWRAPTAAIEGLDSEEWWAAHRANASAPWIKASVGFSRALQSRGIIAAIERERDGRVAVLASVAGEDDTEPRVVRASIGARAVGIGDGANTSTQNQPVPERLADGDLRAFAQRARIALVERVDGQGSTAVARLEAYAIEGRALRSRGTHTISSATVIVTAQGAGTDSEAGFAIASFTGARPGSAGCLAVGEGLCVTPGPLLFARVTASGMRVTEVAREGLADSIAIEPDGRGYLLLYVGVERGQPVQRAARVGLDGSVRESFALRARGLPPIDRPVIVACASEQWLVGEALVGEPDEDAGAQESGVIAVPFDCVRE
jgi:hypothetical protein